MLPNLDIRNFTSKKVISSIRMTKSRISRLDNADLEKEHVFTRYCYISMLQKIMQMKYCIIYYSIVAQILFNELSFV